MKSSIAEMATTLGEDIQICIQCGVCSGSCPVASEMEYTPRKIIAMVRAEMEDEILASESIWRCLSCYLCQVRCPREIKLIDKIVDTRRHLVQEEAKFPQEMIQVFRDIEVYGDTFGMGRSSRLEWAHGLGVEEASEKVEYDALLWLGCEDTFNDRRMQVSRTLVKVLQKAGVKFAALGRNEACCGDPARRLGNEYLFQEMASKNIETLNKFKFKYIMTMCPHCYNVLKNEYRHFGGDYEVLHYTELFGRLLEEKKIEFVYPVGAKVIYHDPCYLGRGNEIYEPPRNILRGMEGLELLEFRRFGENSFCCGGGGGHKWMHEAGLRVSDIRAEEAMEKSPDAICTACPYCLEMFEDSVRTLGLEDRVKTLDLIEVISHAIE